ncbi:hypothetical protein [Streptomyces sp. NPDC048340]|uniref:hypothetical protein n=1 Tax=Streptomyces sp. NPDC048340 TaxID=3365537 RepID=UPI0037113F8E
MNYRSSATLLRLLEEALELTTSPEAGRSIDRAAAYISGPRRHGKYGKGAELVRHLEAGAQAAVLAQDWDMAQRLQRCAAYASGQLPLEVLEVQYDARAKRRGDAYVRGMAEMGSRQAVLAIDQMLRENPQATAADVRDFFQGVARASQYVEIGGTDGGVDLSPKDADRLMFLGRMELAVRRLPRDATPEAAAFLDDLIGAPDASVLVQLVAMKARRESLAALRAAVDDPDSSEADLHACLKNQEWIFGGA